MRKALLLTTALFLPAIAHAACTTAAPNYPSKNGGFGEIDGQMYTPDGQPFVPRGVNVLEQNFTVATIQQVLSQNPRVNTIRVPVYDYADPSTFTAANNYATARGILVVYEDHTNWNADGSNAGNAGGSQGAIDNGAVLARSEAWYKDMGAAFKSDPYDALATVNEPASNSVQNGPSNPAALYAWQQQTITDVRSTGFNGLIFVEAYTDSNGTFEGGLPAGAFANDTGIAVDAHWYPMNVPNRSNDPVVASQALSTMVAGIQSKITTQDGKIAVTSLEAGDSTLGSTKDPNWQATMTALFNSPTGGAVWLWGFNPAGGDALLNADGSPSQLGLGVQAWTAGSGATGCAASPIPPPIVSQAMTNAQNAVTAANNLSIADVANLASQGLTADGSSIGDIAKLASVNTTGSSPGGMLPTDPIVAATLAAGLDPMATPVVRTVDSPGGTMPTPAPVSGSTTFSASGDYQTVVPAPGNATGTVSGTGNTINATSGIQTISVTGSGNTITTGLYNDTITVLASGNTINAGGGHDTIVLAYGGKTPDTTINADAPALPPLAGAGNTFIAPPVGMGVLTIRGTLATGDRIDLTAALAGTAGFNGANMWDFVSATTSAQGCVIAVNGKTVLLLPNGSPNGNIGAFLVARAG